MPQNWLKKYSLLAFDEIDSTNSEALRLIKAGVKGNFVIWSKAQTKGRGRAGKTWHSELGNLYLSLLLSENIAPAQQPQLSFVAAAAVCDAITSLSPDLPLKIKWPNDLLIDDKKIAGILVESINFSNHYYVVIGVGVNLAFTPQQVDKPASSLAEHCVRFNEPAYMLNILMLYIEKWLSCWRGKGFMKVRKYWLQRAYMLGKIVNIDDGRGKISGVFYDIDEFGNMRILLNDNQLRCISAGEALFHE